jgi:hypothetical protein
MKFVLPGMGATSAMYKGPWHDLPDARFVDWPRVAGEITFQTIARTIISSHRISPADCIIGTSLGGIIGLEVARQVDCATVVLISSAIHASEINGLLLKMAPLSSVTPLGFLQLFASCSGDLGAMFSEVDADFIRACCLELAQWSSGPEPSQLYRIHGRDDGVIPCPSRADLILPGGHLVAMTQAERCVAFVDEVLR